MLKNIHGLLLVLVCFNGRCLLQCFLILDLLLCWYYLKSLWLDQWYFYFLPPINIACRSVSMKALVTYDYQICCSHVSFMFQELVYVDVGFASFVLGMAKATMKCNAVTHPMMNGNAIWMYLHRYPWHTTKIANRTGDYIGKWDLIK